MFQNWHTLLILRFVATRDADWNCHSLHVVDMPLKQRRNAERPTSREAEEGSADTGTGETTGVSRESNPRDAGFAVSVNQTRLGLAGATSRQKSARQRAARERVERMEAALAELKLVRAGKESAEEKDNGSRMSIPI
jgi:hypothetical protein